jgi:hypothetical protein
VTDEIIENETAEDVSEELENQDVEESEEETTEPPEEEKAAKEAADLEARKQKRKERNNRRLAAHNQKIEAELAKIREENAYLKGQIQNREPAKPNLEDYDTQEEYLDALTDWKLDKRIAEAESDEPTPEDTETTQLVDQEVYDDYVEKGESQFGDDFKDMMEAASNGEFEASPVMAEAIFESENGPAIAMYLYDNPKESSKIARMTPARQVREILKIEGNLKPQKSVSRAPKPATPETKSGTNPGTVDLAKVKDAEEYRRIRMQQIYGNKR